MAKKVLEYVIALGAIGLMALLLWFILNPFLNSSPVVGQVIVSNLDTEIQPVGNEIYRTGKNTKTESARLKPAEIANELPEIRYDDGFSSRYENGSNTDGFYFTIYNEDLTVNMERGKTMYPPEEPGTYIICIEGYWGTSKNNIGMEYYFKLLVV